MDKEKNNSINNNDNGEEYFDEEYDEKDYDDFSVNKKCLTNKNKIHYKEPYSQRHIRLKCKT